MGPSSPPLWQQPRGNGDGSKSQAWVSGPPGGGRKESPGKESTAARAPEKQVREKSEKFQNPSPPAADAEPIDPDESEEWRREFQEAAAQLSKAELREFVEGHVNGELAAIRAIIGTA